MDVGSRGPHPIMHTEDRNACFIWPTLCLSLLHHTSGNTPNYSLGHNTLLTSQFGNPISRLWSPFKTKRTYAFHVFVAQPQLRHSFAASTPFVYLSYIVPSGYNPFTIVHWVTIGL